MQGGKRCSCTERPGQPLAGGLGESWCSGTVEQRWCTPGGDGKTPQSSVNLGPFPLCTPGAASGQPLRVRIPGPALILFTLLLLLSGIPESLGPGDPGLGAGPRGDGGVQAAEREASLEQVTVPSPGSVPAQARVMEPQICALSDPALRRPPSALRREPRNRQEELEATGGGLRHPPNASSPNSGTCVCHLMMKLVLL